MKIICMMFSICCFLCTEVSVVKATPLDLSYFKNTNPGASIDLAGGIFHFIEDPSYGQSYVFDDAFFVNVPFKLSFTYSLKLGPENYDSLVAAIYPEGDLLPVYGMQTNTPALNAQWELDLTHYHGQKIILAFGLESDDAISGTTASISMVEKTVLYPLPEPGTGLLLGAALCGIGFLRRRKKG